MKFDLQEEVKFIKIRFIGLLLAAFILVAGIVGAFAGIIKNNRQSAENIPSVKYVADTLEANPSATNNLLFNSYQYYVQKVSRASMPEKQQALSIFNKMLDSVQAKSDPAVKIELEKTIDAYRNLAEIAAQSPSEKKAVVAANADQGQVNELQTIVKQRDEKIQALEQQLQAPAPQNRDVQNLLTENKIKDSRIQELQKQLQQVGKPQLPQAEVQKLLADIKSKDNKIQDLQRQMQQMPKQQPQQAILQNLQADNNRKDNRISELQGQLKVAQNAKNKTNNSAISQADYQELLDRNKYLDFDLRSVVKTNLQLTKENTALKKSLQELNSQLRKGSQ